MFLLLGLVAARGLYAQAGNGTAPCAGVEVKTRIALDNGGIANWNFQNPRQPYPILHQPDKVGTVKAASEACFNSVWTRALEEWPEVRFVNETPDRLFEIRVPFKLPRTELGSSGTISLCAPSSSTSPVTPPTATEPEPSPKRVADCDELAARVADPNRGDLDLGKLDVCTNLWENPSKAKVPSDVAARWTAALARVNQVRPLKPPPDDSRPQPVPGPDYCVVLQSILGDKVKGDSEKFAAAFADLCKKSATGYDCTLALSVSQGGATTLDSQLLRYLSVPQNNPSGLLSFSVYFVGEAEQPSHNRGFLQVQAAADEPASSTLWQFSGSVGASTDADLNQRETVFNAAGAEEEAFNPFVSPVLPYRGAREDDFTGGASFKLTQTMGNRADGSATLEFKSGVLGEADQERKVTVSDYAIRLYGDNGTQVRFGKFDLASSREKIALVEKGEAVELLWRFASLGGLFKRENVDGPASKKSERSRSLVLQLKDLPLRGFPTWRSINLLAAHGQNDGQPTFKNLIPATPPDPEKITDDERFLVAYTYDTVGGDASFAVPGRTPKDWMFSGNVAAYWSRREIDEVNHKLGGALADPIDPTGKILEGEGKVGLATVIFSKPGTTGQPSPASFRLQLGYGTGDDAKTANRNEGYVGETTGFVPDKIFLARLAAGVRESLVAIGPGLSNKTYVGLSYTDNRCWSGLPLVFLSRMFGIREPITACNTQLRLHHYELNEKVFANRAGEAGNELNLDFKVTVPKGVTTSLGFGRFRPGSALHDVVKRDPWVLTAGISVTM